MDDILRTIGAFIGMAILGTLIYLFYIDIKKDLTVIDTKVETINGEIYKCTNAYSRNDGMTYIVKPNGKNMKITIPSKEIKIIKQIR
jgi:hypothetical protein